MGLTAWKGRLLFGQKEQKGFLKKLHAMLKAGIPLRSVFENLREFPVHPMERRIAEHSLQNISRGRPYAGDYDKHGWFSPHSSALLQTGQENSFLVHSIEIALASFRPEISAWKIIFLGNLRWLMGMVLGLVICVFIHYQRDIFLNVLGARHGVAAEAVFVVGGFLGGNGAWVLCLFALFFATLLFQLGHVTGPARDRLEAWSPFCEYRWSFARRFLLEMAGLMKAGGGAADALGVLQGIYRTPYYRHRLRELNAAVAGGVELSEAIGRILLHRRHAALMRSLSAAHFSAIHLALSEMGEIISTDLEERYKKIAGRMACLLVALLVFLIYGIMDVVYASPSPID